MEEEEEEEVEAWRWKERQGGGEVKDWQQWRCRWRGEEWRSQEGRHV